MKKLLIIGIIILFTSVSSIAVAQQNQVTRKDLVTALINKHVATVEVKEITMLAGQKAPKHLHPCEVLGYVKTGKVLFQIEGEEEIILNEGDAFYEPKNKNILHFDNASEDQALIFVAVYLKEGEEENIRLMEK